MRWLLRIHTVRFFKIVDFKSQQKGEIVIEYNKTSEREEGGKERGREGKREEASVRTQDGWP